MARHVSLDDLLAAIHDRLLPWRERRFWAHIVRCPQCKYELMKYEVIKARLKGMERDIDMEAVRARYWARIAEGDAARQRAAESPDAQQPAPRQGLSSVARDALGTI